jgi:hypothetical protein
LGANPTIFIFVMAVMVVWVAYAVPHEATTRKTTPAKRPQTARVLRLASLGMAGLIGVAYLATVFAHFAYDSAVVAVRDGDLAKAAADLDTAVALDPGMALYWRQRGALDYISGRPDDAVLALVRASKLNPSDDLAWRTLALALEATGDDSDASRALGQALARQRSDPTNFLLEAERLEKDGTPSSAISVLAEVVQSWPQIVGAPGWVGMLPDEGATADVVDEATRRWERGMSTSERAGDQGLWLTAMADRPADASTAIARAPMSRTLAESELSLIRCNGPVFPTASPEDQRTITYWKLRFWEAALAGEPDETATTMIRIMGGDFGFPGDVGQTLNPLNENGQFSADLWGYGRLPITWPKTTVALPSPVSGALRWLVDPRQAVEESGLSERLPACR